MWWAIASSSWSARASGARGICWAMRLLRVAELMRSAGARSVAAQRQHGLSRLALRVDFVSLHEEETRHDQRQHAVASRDRRPHRDPARQYPAAHRAGRGGLRRRRRGPRRGSHRGPAGRPRSAGRRARRNSGAARGCRKAGRAKAEACREEEGGQEKDAGEEGFEEEGCEEKVCEEKEEEQKDEGETEEEETVSFRQNKTADRGPPFVTEIDMEEAIARSPAAAAHHDSSGARDAARGAW